VIALHIYEVGISCLWRFIIKMHNNYVQFYYIYLNLCLAISLQMEDITSLKLGIHQSPQYLPTMVNKSIVDIKDA
jgi:hypothetical protein